MTVNIFLVLVVRFFTIFLNFCRIFIARVGFKGNYLILFPGYKKGNLVKGGKATIIQQM